MYRGMKWEGVCEKQQQGEVMVTDGHNWQCGIHPARYSARPASGGRQSNKSRALHPVSTAYYIHHDK